VEKPIYNILYAVSLLSIESLSASELCYQESIGKIGHSDIDSRYRELRSQIFEAEIGRIFIDEELRILKSLYEKHARFFFG
jgi:hypothetical protein